MNDMKDKEEVTSQIRSTISWLDIFVGVILYLVE